MSRAEDSVLGLNQDCCCIICILDFVTTTQLATTPPTAVPPNATVSSSSSSPLREGRDSVTLRCAADSNPPPTYIWVRGSDSGEVRATLDIPVVSYIKTYV